MSRPLVVLDIDDTLYLERDYVRSGFQAVDAFLRHTHSFDGFFKSAWKLFLDGRRGDIFDRALASNPRLSQVEVGIEELVSIYRSHTPAISLLPDAEHFIRSASEVADFAVVSDGPAESQRAKAVALGLPQWTDALVFTAEHGTDWAKPSSKAFHHLQTRFAAPSRSCIYYADNPLKDFAGPRQLGWHSVRLRRRYGLHSGIEGDGGAERAIAEFSEAEVNLLVSLTSDGPARTVT